MGLLLSLVLLATPVSVTLDDLPFAGDVGPNDTKAAATARILAALKKHSVPPTGFVVCGRGTKEERKAVLAQWKAAGAELGNHSTQHKGIDTMSLDAWTKDLMGCDAQLKAELEVTPKFYRFPYLLEGKDPATRDAAAEVLKKNGYRNGQVSIDTSDWMLAGFYVDALKKGDKARAANIGQDYVMHVRLAAQRYRGLGQTKWRRDVGHVLLLHANALAADWLDALLAALKKDGFAPVTLEAAMADPMYSEPEVFTGKIGLSWLYRTTDTAAKQWAWDDAQTQLMSMRWDGKTLPVNDELSIRALTWNTWLVVHAKPFGANSVVAEMPDGTLVFIGSPYDPVNTKALIDWLLERLGPRPLVAINTHFHYDGGGGGNAAFIEAGAKVWASDLTAALLTARTAKQRADMVGMVKGDAALEQRFASFTASSPNNVFPSAKGLTLRFLGETLEVKYPGPAHAPDNVVVWFPARKLLVGGCAVVAMPKMGNLADADLKAWPAALEVMRAFKPEVVVPGHAEVGDAKLLDHTLKLVKAAAK